MNTKIRNLGLLVLLVSLCGAVERSAYALTPPSGKISDILERDYRGGASADFEAIAMAFELDTWDWDRLFRECCLPFGQTDETGNTLLHLAVSISDVHKRVEASKQLIRLGEEVNAANDAGWTPLHVMLAASGDSEANRLASKQLAELLVRNGADVNAVTALYGWTPLHMAAALHDAEMVSLLIELGADIGTRSRIGGFRPLEVVDWREQCLPLEERVPEGVVAALEVKEGETPDRRDAEFQVPALIRGSSNYLSSNQLKTCMCREMVLSGSFTTSDAKETLAFVAVGATVDVGSGQESAINRFLGTLVLFVDEEGASQPVFAFDGYLSDAWHTTGLKGGSGTYSVGFKHTSSTATSDLFMYYHRGKGWQVDVVREATPGDEVEKPLGECIWRERRASTSVYLDAVEALRVGHPNPFSRKFKADEATQEGDAMAVPEREHVLPTRVVPDAVVEGHLANIRQLRDDESKRYYLDEYLHWGKPDVRHYQDESSRWRVLVVGSDSVFHHSSYEPCKGVMLVQGRTDNNWRSVFDCGRFWRVEVRGNRLHAQMEGDRYNLGGRNSCHLDIDLLTNQARLCGSHGEE